MAKAIALLSGGLDSTLAILVVMRQQIDVTAVTFLTHFGCDISDSSSCSRNPFPSSEKFGFRVKLSHLSDRFVEIVKNPKHGHGRNMNPCIDCRILMLKEAGEFMQATGSDFIITGEVLGQRPMSQKRNTLGMIDKEAGLKGYVLRPLSAKLLDVTIPEREGLVDRERLYAFSGRSRKPQIALAEELGLTDYPAPAGGCLLTEPNYSYRLKELLHHNPDPSLDELHLLRVGRHFRLSSSCKAVVGRDERENEVIESLAGKNGYLLRVEGVGSPTVLVSGDGAEEFLPVTASLCARYSDARNFPEVDVTVTKGSDRLRALSDEPEEEVSGRGRANRTFKITAAPADERTIGEYRVEKPDKKTRASFRDASKSYGHAF
jgi:tRNA-specific 2-thiouridylase